MAKMEIPVTINTEAVVSRLLEEMATNRLCRMIAMYGEACTKTVAARIVGCNTATICEMIRDGRINSACEGSKVDVASLAGYIDRKPMADHEARMRRKGRTAYV